MAPGREKVAVAMFGVRVCRRVSFHVAIAPDRGFLEEEHLPATLPQVLC